MFGPLEYEDPQYLAVDPPYDDLQQLEEDLELLEEDLELLGEDLKEDPPDLPPEGIAKAGNRGHSTRASNSYHRCRYKFKIY